MANVNEGLAKWTPKDRDPWNESTGFGRDPFSKGPKAIQGEQGPPGPEGPQGPPGLVAEMAVLRPGDKLIIHISDPDPEQVALLIKHLEKLGLRDDRVVILCGAEMVVVVPQAPVDPEEVRAVLIGIQKDMQEIGDST